MALLLAMAIATLLAALVLGGTLVLGLASLPRLEWSDPTVPDPAPSLSIVVAARDEAARICPAVESLLDQDYPGLEVVVVDDRSTDGTGALLDQVADERPGLRVLHLTELPDGWLGKNHALDRGAELASGELILFTDADIVMKPDAVRRAVSMLERRGLDHLAVAPRVSAGDGWATMTLAVFLALFSTVFRPWRAGDPASPYHIGIGAFNMVRRDAYRAIGGHRAVALRPDDDVRLGRALKEAGYRQEAASGRAHVAVEWYPSLGAMARGLRKNVFAAVDYRLWMVAVWTVLALVVVQWPLVAAVATEGAVRWLNLAIVVTGVVTMTAMAVGQGLPAWTGVTYPVGGLLLLWIVWSATLRVVVTGQVEWRGTRYPLRELKADRGRTAAGVRRGGASRSGRGAR